MLAGQSASASQAATGPVARVAVAGATGYTGQELVRILARHPAVKLTIATSSGANTRRLPALAHVWDGVVTPLDPDVLIREADVVFLAVPDSAAAELAPRLLAGGARVIDLSGAFRLRDEALRRRWYPETHDVPEGTVYGLTELERSHLRAARLVTNPGCYPTAAVLALAPLVKANLLEAGSDVIVDAKSGVSGAGKTPSERTHFSEVHGSLSAYGVFNHRHGAEIEQGVGRTVTFTPHLLPLAQGELVTSYVTPTRDVDADEIAELFDDLYAAEPFIELRRGPVGVIDVRDTNYARLSWHHDPRTNRVIVFAAIDNLWKGAASQAVQNLNLMFGRPETEGLR